MAWKHDVRLTASELANLWTQYLNDSLAICFTSHALAHAEDKAVRDILKRALALSERHVAKIEDFLRKEHFPLPKGFTQADDLLNIHAPRLFSDSLLLNYFYVMCILGLGGYAGALASSVREDQRKYFMECNTETMKLFDQIVDVMLEKGIFFRTPNLNTPDGIDFVERQSFLTGWIGKQRPINAIEMSGLYYNMAKLAVKIVLEIGFGQVVESAEIRKYLQRGADICNHQFDAMSDTLSENDLPSPRKWQSEITNSTVAPFSDKLMLFHVVALVSASAAFYGAGLSVIQRRDLGIKYSRLVAEIGLYAEDGVNLLIANGWLEQPPTADDRKALANQK
ncbi:DUF3231 family protein [Paenibacillus methanolicus]|uniref:Uncharacterized protein DUF3231 n=1 Tax=Paenibacillus methanolicus TaxID=582686 RepID=A0A5S5CD86_9BACL|nr:DUF3231 family protein [Paenibacillus methanolicus]TYP76472.1 uncharacterized protein DUF3231 [Paenibacillus methanolicus]